MQTLENGISQKIAEYLVRTCVIDPGEKDLYRFGIDQLLDILLNFLTTLVISLLLGMVWESMIFMATYFSIRCYAGGYHAKSRIRCYLFSTGITLFALFGVFLLKGHDAEAFLLLLMGNAAVLLLAPIENSNKPLKEMEVKIYRKRTVVLVLFQTFLVIVLQISGIGITLAPMAMASFLLGCMLVLGKIEYTSGEK